MHVIRAFAAAAFVAGAAVSAAVPAAALEQGRTTDARSPNRAVLICDTDASTRRAFTREHGAPPVFITAREAQAVRPSDPAWTAPRCMTEREHAKLREANLTYARVP